MTPTFSRAALRRLDALAASKYALPTLVLMENAAGAVARHALAFVSPRPLRSRAAIIVAGAGNNGGDGLAAARHLHNAGVRVAVVLAAPLKSYQGDAGVHLAAARAMRLPILTFRPGGNPMRALVDAARRVGSASPVLIDGVLGTGLNRAVTGDLANLVFAINDFRSSRGAMVLSIDLPSGMDADTGRGWGPPGYEAVRADVTVTLTGLKRGFRAPGARAYLGKVVVEGVGAPRELLARLADKPARARPRRRASPG